MRAETLPWHEAAWRSLARRLEEGRMPHALLVSGPQGLGKREFIAAFAAGLLCRSPVAPGRGCGECQACHLVASGAHPDLSWVEPSEGKRQIVIDQVRALGEFLSLKSQYGGYRVGLIYPADAMNLAAANGLLKTLEEPAPGALLLLAANRSARLPATIRSRCQRVEIGPPPREQGREWLLSRGAAQAAELLELAGGAPLRALQLAEEGVAEHYRSLLAGLEGLRQGRRDPVALAESALAAGARTVVTLWLQLAVELARAGAGATPRYGDADRLRALAKGLDLVELHRFMDRLLDARRQLDQTPNEQLLLEELFIGWQRLSRTAAATGT